MTRRMLAKLEAIQNKLRSQISLVDNFDYPPKVVTGFDLAYKGELGIAAAVSLDYESFSVLETKVLISQVKFPYIPTYLAFREAPLIIQILKKLKIKPDVIMVDGHGIAHPRKLGSATYIGIITKKPSIGVAKRNLCGTYLPPTNIYDSKPVIFNDEIVGYAIKTKPNTSPIFISPGTNISVETTKRIVLHLIKNHKLPEPLFLADKLSKESKKKLLT